MLVRIRRKKKNNNLRIAEVADAAVRISASKLSEIIPKDKPVLLASETILAKEQAVRVLEHGEVLGVAYLTNFKFHFVPHPAFKQKLLLSSGKSSTKSKTSDGSKKACGTLADPTTLLTTKEQIVLMEEYIHVPLLTISRLFRDRKKQLLEIYCKDFRVYQFTFQPASSPAAAEKFYDHLVKFTFLDNPKHFFAFFNNTVDGLEPEEELPPGFEGWTLYDPDREFARLGIPNEQWRLTYANSKYTLCPTYPRVLCVPARTTDADLQKIVAYRSKQRFPILSWLNPRNRAAILRCSQPKRGIMRHRSREDEELFRIVQAATTPPPSLASSNTSNATQPKQKILYFLDARPYLNARANQAHGYGFENIDNYENATLEFFGIDNIHVMRNSFNRLADLCLSGVHGGRHVVGGTTAVGTASGTSGWWAGLEQTGWLGHVRLVLEAATRVARLVAAGYTTIVHCSDGWDRTAQLTSLASLMLDPYYRTIRGFAVLIEKEWIAAGHKFHTRCGHGAAGSNDDGSVTDKDTSASDGSGSAAGSGGATTGSDKERAPIFLQFCDATWQLMQQFPTAFQFNELFLLHIMDALYSCQFGTFLYNCDAEREAAGVRGSTVSLWTQLLVNGRDGRYTNPDYPGTRLDDPDTWLSDAFGRDLLERYAAGTLVETPEVAVVIFPETNTSAIALWRGFYLRHISPHVVVSEQLNMASVAYRLKWLSRARGSDNAGSGIVDLVDVLPPQIVIQSGAVPVTAAPSGERRVTFSSAAGPLSTMSTAALAASGRGPGPVSTATTAGSRAAGPASTPATRGEGGKSVVLRQLAMHKELMREIQDLGKALQAREEQRAATATTRPRNPHEDDAAYFQRMLVEAEEEKTRLLDAIAELQRKLREKDRLIQMLVDKGDTAAATSGVVDEPASAKTPAPTSADKPTAPPPLRTPPAEPAVVAKGAAAPATTTPIASEDEAAESANRRSLKLLPLSEVSNEFRQTVLSTLKAAVDDTRQIVGLVGSAAFAELADASTEVAASKAKRALMGLTRRVWSTVKDLEATAREAAQLAIACDAPIAPLPAADAGHLLVNVEQLKAAVSGMMSRCLAEVKRAGTSAVPTLPDDARTALADWTKKITETAKEILRVCGFDKKPAPPASTPTQPPAAPPAQSPPPSTSSTVDTTNTPTATATPPTAATVQPIYLMRFDDGQSTKRAGAPPAAANDSGTAATAAVSRQPTEARPVPAPAPLLGTARSPMSAPSVIMGNGSVHSSNTSSSHSTSSSGSSGGREGAKRAPWSASNGTIQKPVWQPARTRRADEPQLAANEREGTEDATPSTAGWARAYVRNRT